LASLKYLWVRSKEISEGHLTLGDIRQMKKTGRLPLHTKKRTSNPEPFQQPVVIKDFIKEWNIYEQFRDSNDWSDEAPAIVLVKSNGQPINRRWIRRRLQVLREKLDLPETFTPHNIRRSMHTLCRSVINNRMIAQVQLGDTSYKVADEHYNIPDTELIQRELEKLYSGETLADSRKTPFEIYGGKKQ